RLVATVGAPLPVFRTALPDAGQRPGRQRHHHTENETVPTTRSNHEGCLRVRILRCGDGGVNDAEQWAREAHSLRTKVTISSKRSGRNAARSNPSGSWDGGMAGLFISAG